LIDVLIRW